MLPRSIIVVTLLLAVLAVGAGGLYIYDHSKRDVIAKGVTVAGIDIGGLHSAAARARLRHRFLKPLGRPVLVAYHGRRFRLTARQARVGTDVDAAVRTALARSRSGSIFTRAAREIGDGTVDAHLNPRIAYSRRAVARLVAGVERALTRSPRDAHVSFSGAGITQEDGRMGLAVAGAPLRRDIRRALVRPAAPHVLRVKTRRVKPKVTKAQLAAKYPAIIMIDRKAFRLRLFKHLKPVKSYTIAVGRQGLETPAGLYDIQSKQVNPSWHVPTSSWAGALAGRVIPPGPQDPLKARWLGFNGGAGIHGTAEAGSLGSAASHGCIRMAIPDVIELYNQVSTGDPVYVA